jgi:hypothetical protein
MMIGLPDALIVRQNPGRRLQVLAIICSELVRPESMLAQDGQPAWLNARNTYPSVAWMAFTECFSRLDYPFQTAGGYPVFERGLLKAM